MQTTSGDVPPAAQNGLKPTYVKQGLFLACQCKPTEDLTVQFPYGAGIEVPVQIFRREMLNHNVLRLHLRPEGEFACEPGQFVTLINNVGTARSYSVANDPDGEGYIELHVRLLNDGVMSQFLQTQGEIGTLMNNRGPAGNCFYVCNDNKQYPIVLAGTGTGLAPLYGIARQALAKGHKGPIQLFHGALKELDLYMTGPLQALQSSYDNFRYVPCVLAGETGRFYRCAHIEDTVMSSLASDKAATRLFLCGAPDFVKSLKRKTFLAGIRSFHIFADAFLPSQGSERAA
jgi:NAD(P)H-flavin reductase